MSIIHEALKKVQSDRLQNKEAPAVLKEPEQPVTPAAPPVRPAPISTPERPQGPSPAVSKRSPVERFVWSALIVSLAGFTFFNLAELTEQTVSTTQSATPSLPSALQQAASTDLAASSRRQKDNLILSGITLMDGKKFALINNGIYEVGDEVEDAVVTRITDKSVIVSQKGKTRILKVTHR